MNENLMKEMILNFVHFGHKTEKWNPKMRSYIYTKRDNIHILDLRKTVSCLEKACQFLKKASSEKKVILFISTKPQCEKIIKENALKAEMPYVTGHWISGLLTNFETVKKRIKYLRDLKEQERTGEFEKYTKKEAQNLKKTIEKLEASLGGVRDLQRIPHALFILDTVIDAIAIREAKKLGIPIVAIVDSNSDPTKIQYPIPGNDDAIKSLNYLTEKITESIIEGKKLS